MATEPTQPSAETRAEEAKEAHKDHGATSPENDGGSSAPTSVNPDVAAHEKEMAERGANVQGEGKI